MKTSSASTLFQPYTIWVLTPYLESEDPNIQHYYDFSQSLLEYTRVFEELEADWKWQPVTLANYKQVIQTIASTKERTPLILNLCDGDEINGAPGVSVIHALEKAGLIYTGADAYFYNITTSKIPMKKAFDKAGVPHASWRVISASKKGSVKGICKRVGTPLIIKPAVSGGSMGVSVKNVVHTEEQLLERIEELNKGYRGWNLLTEGVFVEQFVSGPEYTTFITGSSTDPDTCIVYEPVERVFHHSLPAAERFLSFDRLWEIYEDESPMPGNANFYEYRPASAAITPVLKELSLKAYKACGGMGYTRIDIRQDEITGKLYMLEANAQCGLSEDEDYTSIGAILKASNVSFTTIIVEILKDALRRSMINTSAGVRKASHTKTSGKKKDIKSRRPV